MEKFNSEDFFANQKICPFCNSTSTHAPGPVRHDQLMNQYWGWLLCYSCGKRASIQYTKRDDYSTDLPLYEGHG